MNQCLCKANALQHALGIGAQSPFARFGQANEFDQFVYLFLQASAAQSTKAPKETQRFFGRLCGLGGARLKEQINELIELVGLTKARKRRLGTYSKGMLQRIGLAQALIHDPRLVVLDEPTAGVDPAGSREIRDLILNLKRRGITVLLSSHLLAQAQEICDRIGILADGVLVREGRLQELIAIENQTEFVIADASDELVREIESVVNRSRAKLIERRKSTTTLERLFLEATAKNDEGVTKQK